MMGILEEGADLINYIVILGKKHIISVDLWMYFDHFKRDLQINYETEKYISFKANKHKGKLLETPLKELS